MRSIRTAFIFFIGILPCLALGSPPDAIRLSIVRTGTVTTLEKFVFADGRWFTPLALNHSAVLVDHPKGRVLFDTGLGERIDTQFARDMPWWSRILFPYTRQESALRQLQQAGERLPEAIILSHGHWDHAGGVVDFGGLPVWLHEAELAFLGEPHPGSVLASQLADLAGRARPLSLPPAPVGNYPRSLDVFGDGRVLVIGMPGHTPGSVGLLVQASSGRKFFFVGDVVWSIGALAGASPKFWLPSSVVDHDAGAARESVLQLRDFMMANPDVTIVPAHDAGIQDKLGYFPRWID